ncbi:Co2+/Mg2+ efflux protein ApaG [Sphingomonas sp. ASV193]|uniref:Co2+/Mg2+ efflux protein ApaG n=1 Tax=Sphingomonas sp. ASV193 TaxID=3144405 RepID=UPI0032E8D955
MIDAMALLFPNVAKTGAVTVRVAVSYLSEQSDPGGGRWFWSYHVRVENDGDEPLQLVEREWRIVDAEGRAYDVRGEGVVGEMPLIMPGESFDYVSGCPLATSHGSMSGSYRLLDSEGRDIHAAIPAFDLVGPPAEVEK